MKNIGLLSSALCLLLSCAANAQILADDFNGITINSALWTTYNTSFGNSSITEGGGNATFINGAGLITVSSFVNATVQGSFQFAGDNDDRFKVVLRSDGTTFDPHWQDSLSGIQIQFSPSSNPSPGIQSLQIIDLGTGTVLAQATPQINTGTFYNFTITDSGSQIGVYFAGSASPTLSALTSTSYGDKIEIFSREQAAPWGPAHTSQLDFVSITTVPEPSFIALGSLGSLLFVLHSRLKRR